MVVLWELKLYILEIKVMIVNHILELLVVL